MLSERQKCIVIEVMKGRTLDQVAAALGCSPRLVAGTLQREEARLFHAELLVLQNFIRTGTLFQFFALEDMRELGVPAAHVELLQSLTDALEQHPAPPVE